VENACAANHASVIIAPLRAPGPSLRILPPSKAEQVQTLTQEQKQSKTSVPASHTLPRTPIPPHLTLLSYPTLRRRVSHIVRRDAHTHDHAVVQTAGHPGSAKRHTLIFLLDVATRRLALPESCSSNHHQDRQGQCPAHSEHRCGPRCQSGGEGEACAGFQSRGLHRSPAIEAVQDPRDGPLVRGHEGWRDIPRDDVETRCQAYLSVFF
jgi:hypothetical protein